MALVATGKTPAMAIMHWHRHVQDPTRQQMTAENISYCAHLPGPLYALTSPLAAYRPRLMPLSVNKPMGGTLHPPSSPTPPGPSHGTIVEAAQPVPAAQIWPQTTPGGSRCLPPSPTPPSTNTHRRRPGRPLGGAGRRALSAAASAEALRDDVSFFVRDRVTSFAATKSLRLVGGS